MSLSKRMMGINLLGAAALIAVVLTAAFGFQDAKHRWSVYEQTVVHERDELQTISAEMGYTWLIHKLKNFVLRGNESDYLDIQDHHADIASALDRYADIQGLNQEDKLAIASLHQMNNRYLEAANVVREYRQEQQGTAELSIDIHAIDTLVKIDDQPYEQAMQTLRTNAKARTTEHGRALSVYFTKMLVLVACFALCGMVLILGAGTYLCRRIAAATAAKEQELSEQRDAADEANHAKSAFLASVSHEVRTPMTAILGFADVLAETGCESPTQLDYVQTIRKNGEHLLKILNHVLDLSKIEAGRMTCELSTVSLRQVVEEVASLMRVRAIERGLSLEVEYMPDVPEQIQTDPLRIRQILINLVGNAIKFTEEGGVRIIVRSNRQASWMSVEIVDTGVGMCPQQMDRLYQPFAQGDETMARRFGGTGLGLSLCKRFVEMLGGQLSACSTLGQGSAFWFNLPIADDHNQHAIEQEPRAASQPITEDLLTVPLAGRVLLAEDGPDNQRLIRFILKQFGLDVDVVADGRAAVDQALAAAQAGQAYDVVLMDMQMPILDGYRATIELREHGYTGTIIALTAHAMSEDRTHCLATGCDEYASKPIDKQALRLLLGRYLSEERQAA